MNVKEIYMNVVKCVKTTSETIRAPVNPVMNFRMNFNVKVRVTAITPVMHKPFRPRATSRFRKSFGGQTDATTQLILMHANVDKTCVVKHNENIQN